MKSSVDWLDDEPKFLCGIKLLRVVTVCEYESDNNSCENRFSCAFCGRRFRFQSRLEQHVATHTGEKNYACPSCGKRFTQDGSLKRHMKQACMAAANASYFPDT